MGERERRMELGRVPTPLALDLWRSLDSLFGAAEGIAIVVPARREQE